MHKDPIKFRFITAAARCSMKPLSVILHKVLKFLKVHFKNYCRVAEKRGNKAYYYSINSSYQLIDYLGKHGNRIKGANCADFTNLFTNLDRDVIIKSLKFLLNLSFRNFNITHICVGKVNATGVVVQGASQQIMHSNW